MNLLWLESSSVLNSASHWRKTMTIAWWLARAILGVCEVDLLKTSLTVLLVRMFILLHWSHTPVSWSHCVFLKTNLFSLFPAFFGGWKNAKTFQAFVLISGSVILRKAYTLIVYCNLIWLTDIILILHPSHIYPFLYTYNSLPVWLAFCMNYLCNYLTDWKRKTWIKHVDIFDH